MATIGVRELKQHASQVLRRVRERGEEIEVTHHGRVVARLVPVERQRSRQSPSAAWSTESVGPRAGPPHGRSGKAGGSSDDRRCERRRQPPRAARHASRGVLQLPSLRLLTIDEALARAAAAVAARLRTRGADAVYIAAAARLRLPLVTWDAEQGDRAAEIVEVLVPDS